ncbi:MAG: hypothetical protein K6G32_02785 [Prevotella sp.]|nr:hypothetical protein [Prevotella sp.]
MKVDKSNIVSGSIGALLGACSVWGIGALTDNESNVTSQFFHSFSWNAKQTMYDKVDVDLEGDVYITPKGKKYHAPWCYILKNTDEKKQASRSSVISVGYKPCRKCKP